MLNSPGQKAVSQVADGRSAGSCKPCGEESVRSVRLWAWPPLVRPTSLAFHDSHFFKGDYFSTITSPDNLLSQSILSENIALLLDGQ